jgi:hypothetical protein
VSPQGRSLTDCSTEEHFVYELKMKHVEGAQVISTSLFFPNNFNFAVLVSLFQIGAAR